MRRWIIASLCSCPTLFGLGIVEAQSLATRQAIVTEAHTLAPSRCGSILALSEDATLDEQENYWDSLAACLTAEATQQRVTALSGDSIAQSRAILSSTANQKTLADIAAAKEEVQNQKDFLGWSWGVGFGFGISDGDRVDEAQIVNGVVHVTKESSEQARVFLEYHWFPESWQKTLGKKQDQVIVRAQGPFIAISSRDDKILSGAGFGWSIGFRDKGKSEGFGISIGAMLDNEVVDLPDGFHEGQPPPNGETVIRTETKSRISYVLFFTRAF